MNRIILITPSDLELIALRNNDIILNDLFLLIGNIELTIRNNYFESLVMSIIGQQLSSKAASTIRARVRDLCSNYGGEISPTTITLIPTDQLRNAGVSNAKITYIMNLTERVLNKEIDFNEISSLDNSEIIKILSKTKGIGKWTAEMFLIFSLGRKDVLSVADAGLQRAAKWLYKLQDREDGNYLEQLRFRWNPYESLVSLYLWEAIDRGYVDSGKTIEELKNN